MRAPVDDQAGVEARAADVGGDHVVDAERARQLGRALGARDRARHDRLERPRLGLGERHRAAAGAGDERGCRRSRARRAASSSRAQVDGHARPRRTRRSRSSSCARTRGTRPRPGARARSRPSKPALAQRLLGGELVLPGSRRRGGRRSRRSYALGLEELHRLADAVGLERRVHAAVGVHALRHRKAQAARHERRRVASRTGRTGRRGRRAGSRARRGSRSWRAGRRRRRVRSSSAFRPTVVPCRKYSAAPDALLRDGGGDGVEDALLGRRRGRRLLADAHLAGLVVVEDQVGERPADVHADARGHCSDSPHLLWDCDSENPRPGGRARGRPAGDRVLLRPAAEVDLVRVEVGLHVLAQHGRRPCRRRSAIFGDCAFQRRAIWSHMRLALGRGRSPCAPSPRSCRPPGCRPRRG